jgi:hypothetical protein
MEMLGAGLALLNEVEGRARQHVLALLLRVGRTGEMKMRYMVAWIWVCPSA